MSFTPTSGQYAAAQLGTGALGSNTMITVPGINWSLDWDSKAKDVSNFRDGLAHGHAAGLHAQSHARVG